MSNELEVVSSRTETEVGIIKWGVGKGIPLTPSNALSQMEKTLEEHDEVVAEIKKFLAGGGGSADARHKIKMELGDMFVTLALQCGIWGTSWEECASMALEKISKRKGKIVDGKFVKDGKG